MWPADEDSPQTGGRLQASGSRPSKKSTGREAKPGSADDFSAIPKTRIVPGVGLDPRDRLRRLGPVARVDRRHVEASASRAGRRSPASGRTPPASLDGRRLGSFEALATRNHAAAPSTSVRPAAMASSRPSQRKCSWCSGVDQRRASVQAGRYSRTRITTEAATIATTNPSAQPEPDPPRPGQAVDPDARQGRDRQRDPEVIAHRDPRAADDRHEIHVIEQAGVSPEHEQHAQPRRARPRPRPSGRGRPPRRRRPGPCRSGRGRRSSRGTGNSRRSSRCRGRACRRPRGRPGSAAARATTTRR